MKSVIRILPSIFAWTIVLGGCGSSTASGSTVTEQPAEAAATAPSASVPTPTAAATIEPTKTAAPSFTLTSAQDYSAVGCLKAHFVADVTIPDDYEIPPNTPFTKTWRLENAGDCTWDSAFELVFDHGERMDAPDAVPLDGGKVAPGGTIDVSVELTSPAKAGTHQSYFKLRAPDGTVFGIGAEADTAFWLKIVVTENSQVAAAPVIEYTSDVITIEPMAKETFTVACPAGTAVTGGGFVLGGYGLDIMGEYPTDNGWTVVAHSATMSASVELKVYANCLTLSGAATSHVSETLVLPPQKAATKAVACPAGSVVVGGGYRISKGDTMSVRENRRFANGWRATAIYPYDDSSLTVYAICLATALYQSSSDPEGVDIPPDEIGMVDVSCPSGTVLTGIGWYFGSDSLVVNFAAPYGSKWRVRAESYETHTARLTVNAVCLGVAG